LTNLIIILINHSESIIMCEAKR